MEPFHESLHFSKAALGEFNPTLSEGRTGHRGKRQQPELTRSELSSMPATDTSAGFLVYCRFYLMGKERGKGIHKSSVTKNRYVSKILGVKS